MHVVENERHYKSYFERWRRENYPKYNYYITSGDFGMSMLILGHPFKKKHDKYDSKYLYFECYQIGKNFTIYYFT